MLSAAMHLVAYAHITAACAYVAVNSDIYFVPAAFPSFLAAIACALMLRTGWNMRRQRKMAAWELWNEPPRQDMLPPA